MCPGKGIVPGCAGGKFHFKHLDNITTCLVYSGALRRHLGKLFCYIFRRIPKIRQSTAALIKFTSYHFHSPNLGVQRKASLEAGKDNLFAVQGQHLAAASDKSSVPTVTSTQRKEGRTTRLPCTVSTWQQQRATSPVSQL